MFDRWALAFAHNQVNPSLVAQPTWLEPPPGRFYADPFLTLSEGGVPWVFFEDYDGHTQRGHISASPLLEFSPIPALRLPWHLSYPQLVSDQGQLFCIPEQHQANQVTLYRCLSFPDQWKVEAVLLDGFAGVDPTVFWVDGNWWMWVGDQNGRARDNTHLFHAPKLTGPWRGHRSNPVIQRTDLARPAGQPWLHQGRWYRPAQNRSQTYGGSLVIYRVEQIDHQDYQETEWARWKPHPTWPYPHGLHHVCRLGEWTIWDAKRYVEEL
mgnify:CR=1 FL=1